MTNIKHIFKVREPIKPIFSDVPRVPQEDYTIRKNIDTKEGTILKVPTNPYDIANKAYVDSKIGTAAVADHSSLSNLSYASSGHTGFSSTGPVALNTAKVSYTGLASDHGTAATDQIVNVCYGTSATPPTANTTTEGALYIQYTA